MSSQTLNLSRPFGKTLIIAFVILLAMIGAGEYLMRQRQVQEYFDSPSLNSRHLHLERQWHRLETLTRSGVKIDCIALGNSMVLNSFDPQVFAQQFQTETGKKVRCFNFGVDALTPVAAEALAQILIDTYHPWLLIYGTDARDFAIPQDSEETTVVMDMAWIQYRLGRFSVEGWLIDHSYLFRYRYRLAALSRLGLRERTDTIHNQYGFEPLDITAEVSIPPNPMDQTYSTQYYFRVLNHYTIQPENKAAFSDLLEKEARVVVVEMPVPDTYFSFFGNPEVDYKALINTLESITAQHNVLLLQSTAQHLIPEDGWMDYSHVNYKGAPLFSDWLGKQVGKAFAEGQLSGPLP